MSPTETYAKALFDALIATASVPHTPAQEFSVANRQRCEAENGFNHPLHSWSTSDWFTAILGELGEAANVAKKLNRYRDGIRGNKETETALQDKLRKELGDTFVYLDLICQSLGFNVMDAAIEVFNAKSVDIGYPVQLVASPPAAAVSQQELLTRVAESAKSGEPCTAARALADAHNNAAMILAHATELCERFNRIEFPPDSLQWTVDNIYTIARRESRRHNDGKMTRPEMWGHVLRLCEKAGANERTVGVLREGE